MTDDLIVDLFSGPDGWRTGLAMLGYECRSIGVEKDATAAATAEAAGHPTYVGDLSMLAVNHFGLFRGLIGSPPCQSFSTAGKGLGKLDKPRILRHVERIREAGRWLHYSRDGWHDDNSPLVLEPLRWALEGQPEWIALEQVPAVLPLWEAFAVVLNEQGYAVDTGILSAEQYGVPQTRKRAFLVARLSDSMHAWDEVRLPSPTHAAYRKDKPSLPAHLPRWVSMAEALGLDPDVLMRSNYGTGGDASARGERLADEPAPAVTTKINRNRWIRTNQRSGGTGDYYARPVSLPSPTVTGNARSYRWSDGESVSLKEAGVLQTFPADYPWRGGRTKQFEQVGNAVPPLLAAAVLGNLLDLPNWRDVCMSMRPAIDLTELEAA